MSKLTAALKSAAAFALLFLPTLLAAYGKHLTDEDVRDAYFLGQDAGRCAAFLERYAQMLPVPSTGPQVSQIELQTPYAQIVAVSRLHVTAYSAQQALADYKQRGDNFRVHVQILFTPSYANRPPDFWRDASISLVHKSADGPCPDGHDPNACVYLATDVDGQTIYGSGDSGPAWPIGASLFTTFPTHGIAPDDTVDIVVGPPSGPPVRATFDLSALK